MTRDELNKANAALTAERDELAAKVEALEGQAAETITAHEAALTVLQDEIEAGATRAADLNQLITDANKDSADVRAMLDERNEQIRKLEAALANPAHIDATITPASSTATVSDAEADQLDAAAAAAGEDAEPKTVREQYEAMPFGAARQAFLREHRNEILNATEAE